MPLADTLQISFTQYTDFSVSSELITTLHILISSSEISNTSTNFKFGVRKYFNKVIVDGTKRAQYKLCSDISYTFPKNVGTDPLSRHIRSKLPEHQPRQTQISTLGDTLSTFTNNHATGKTNLPKILFSLNSLLVWLKTMHLHIILESLIIRIMSRSVGMQ